MAIGVMLLSLVALALARPSLPYPDRTPHGPPCSDCPNIIFALTDDQDVTLGGWTPMRWTQARIEANGVTLSNWVIHTPICSPSRSETVSGRYFHNIKSKVAVPPPKVMPAATDHINGELYENASFGVYLRSRKGYNVGMFGKSNFNTYQGFDRWFQSAFLGYGGKWDDDESPGGKYFASKTEYATALIGNKTVEWLRRDNVTGTAANSRPFFVYFAPHCPHAPATPAHWYADECKDVKAPRQPNYNYSSSDFHELIASQPPLTDVDALLIDELARSRCQCLLSVDDAYKAIYDVTSELGVAHKTYWFISSDHGYNLGGHRLPSNKFLLYDHSLRIPMVVAGPGVPRGVQLPHLGTNVDYAPTWLALAGIPTPETMDGCSMLPFLLPNASHPDILPATRQLLIRQRGPLPSPGSDADQALIAKLSDPVAFRTEQFIEYYNQGPWAPGNGGADCPICHGRGTTRMLDDASNTYIGLHVVDPALGSGHYKYAEYQEICSSRQMETKTCFNNITMRELFDLAADPWELHNIAETQDMQVVLQELARRLRTYYACVGTKCPGYREYDVDVVEYV